MRSLKTDKLNEQSKISELFWDKGWTTIQVFFL